MRIVGLINMRVGLTLSHALVKIFYEFNKGSDISVLFPKGTTYPSICYSNTHYTYVLKNDAFRAEPIVWEDVNFTYLCWYLRPSLYSTMSDYCTRINRTDGSWAHNLNGYWSNMGYPEDSMPVESLKHEGHILSKNQVRGKDFFYCRNCKEEVEESGPTGARLFRYRNEEYGKGFEFL